MEEQQGIAIIAVCVLFGFMAFCIPQLLNNVYSYSGSTGYGPAMIIGLALLILCSFIYFIIKVLIE